MKPISSESQGRSFLRSMLVGGISVVTASALVTGMTQDRAKAVVLAYQGQSYDFNIVAELGTSTNLAQQFWFGDHTAASNVATFLSTRLDFSTFTNGRSAYLAYNTQGSLFLTADSINSSRIVQTGLFGGAIPITVDVRNIQSYIVATTPAASTSVPEPTGIVGTVMAMGVLVTAKRKLTLSPKPANESGKRS
jgi:hypothetical protein